MWGSECYFMFLSFDQKPARSIPSVRQTVLLIPGLYTQVFVSNSLPCKFRCLRYNTYRRRFMVRGSDRNSILTFQRTSILSTDFYSQTKLTVFKGEKRIGVPIAHDANQRNQLEGKDNKKLKRIDCRLLRCLHKIIESP